MENPQNQCQYHREKWENILKKKYQQQKYFELSASVWSCVSAGGGQHGTAGINTVANEYLID